MGNPSFVMFKGVVDLEIKLKIKNGHLMVYEVNSKYREYLEQFESRVSQKENRKFYGIIIKKDKFEYCIPFTSKVKSRSSKLTINIKNKQKTIAQLLLNNMIPVTDKQIKLVDIENEKYSDYLKSEIIYLNNKQVINEIISKITNIFKVLEDKQNIDYMFFKKLCCDFKRLEKIYMKYNKN